MAPSMSSFFRFLSDRRLLKTKGSLNTGGSSLRKRLTYISRVDETVPYISSEQKHIPISKIYTNLKLQQGSYNAAKHKLQLHSFVFFSHQGLLMQKTPAHNCHNLWVRWHYHKFASDALLTLKEENGAIRFCTDKSAGKDEAYQKGKKIVKREKMSCKAKLNELRFYRLKAKKKMKSPNPEVRIRYKLEKAKRKEEWLIEKLRKFEVPKPPGQAYDPEILTKEERFYLKRTGEKKKNYVPVGRRGVFGGVVLNMHLHWKRHETIKVVCKPCRPGQVYEYAQELARLSKGIVIDINANNTILFYRGKNYEQPDVMLPPETLSKQKALEKYKHQQSLEHTSQFIEILEEELEEYHNHIARYRKSQEVVN